MHALGLTRRDPVEVLLHLRGEVVVDEVAEVLLEQSGDGERQPGGTSAVPFLKTYPRSRIDSR